MENNSLYLQNIEEPTYTESISPDHGFISPGNYIQPCPSSTLIHCDSGPHHLEYQKYDDEQNSPKFIHQIYEKQIQFESYSCEKSTHLLDSSNSKIQIDFGVNADKGFLYSEADQAFICQKKNHFQLTIDISLSQVPMYAVTSEGPKEIIKFFIDSYGIKHEMPSHKIDLMQSQTDRSKRQFNSPEVDLKMQPFNKFTFGRLHFSSTTSNNMRRKGKRNPHQRYFHLVVSLVVQVGDEKLTVTSVASEKIICRATSPGQFENEPNEPIRLLKMENAILKQKLNFELQASGTSYCITCKRPWNGINPHWMDNYFPQLTVAGASPSTTTAAPAPAAGVVEDVKYGSEEDPLALLL